jgi:hypothetical protein
LISELNELGVFLTIGEKSKLGVFFFFTIGEKNAVVFFSF